MAVPLTYLKEFKCSYKDCPSSFDTEKQMNNHKVDDHEFYCKKCDFDGVDWEDSLGHKVEDMMPWLVGDLRHESPKKFKHIVCEFCGVDFGSLGGRKIHRKQQHQAEQHIQCSGEAEIWNPKTRSTEFERCQAVFGRASQLLRHIEEGHCLFIKRSQLEKERQHKQIVKEIFKDPESFTSALHGGRATSPDTENPCSTTASDDDDSDNEGEGPSGGVRIGPLDDDSNGHAAIYAPLQPEKHSTDVMESERHQDRSDHFPKLNPENEASWDALHAALERSQLEDARKNNLLHKRFWDPSDSDYNSKLFYNKDNRQYVCPFGDCRTPFLIEADIATHLRMIHIDTIKQCRVCYRIFKSLTALVQHCEDSARGGKCRVARTDDYSKLIHEATGGLLSVTKVKEEKIWGLNMPKVQDRGAYATWEKPDGIRDYDYHADRLPLRDR